MKLRNLEAALQARPFRPFQVRVDGDVIVIEHPEQVLLAEEKTTVIVDAVDRIDIFDVDAIAKLTRLRRPGRAGSKPCPSRG